MTAMNRHLRMNVIVDVRGMNVNMRVGDNLNGENFLRLSAKGAHHVNVEPGAAPQDSMARVSLRHPRCAILGGQC